MISRSRRLSCVFVSLDIADPQRLNAKKLASAAKKVALGDFLSSEAVADVPGLPEVTTVVGDDEVEIRAQRHTQQAVNGRDRPDVRQVQTICLTHALGQLIAHGGVLRQQVGPAIRATQGDANESGG